MTDPSAQDAIDLDRQRLLRGRGPGASPREIARSTRDRTEIGGVAVPELLEASAAQAAVVRGDVAALADRATRQRARLAEDLSAVAERADRAARLSVGWAISFLAGLLAGWLLRSRRGSRSTGGPPASRPARAPRSRRPRRTRSR